MNTSPQPLKTCLEPSTALEKATAKRVSLNNQTKYSFVSHFLHDVGHELTRRPNKAKEGTADNPAIGTMDNPLTEQKYGNPNYTKHYLGKIQPRTFHNRANNIALCNMDMVETTHANGITAPHGYSCKDKLCYTCNSIKAYKRTIMFQRALAQTILDDAIPLEDLRLIMITLSPPNVPLEDTRNTTKALNALVHTLLTYKSLLRYRFAPKETWGYIRGTEWTGNNFKAQLAIGKTHPHVHLLMVTDWAYYDDRKSKKKGKKRYLDQKKHELTELIKAELAYPIVITDYNSNETDADGNPIPVPIEVNIPDCNVDIRIVFDGSTFARKNKERDEERIKGKLKNAIFEIVKGFKFDSADEGMEQKALEYAEDFCDEVKKNSKDALNYPDKGALSPEHIRKLGTIDREKNRKYQQAKELYEQGAISQEQLAEHEFKPYFMMFCEQIRGLRTFGSGGIFARCKLEQIGIDSPPEQARIIHYDADPVEQLKLKPPKGKDKKKTLGQRIHEQIEHSNCHIEPPQTALKGNEQALIEQAWGGELSYELICRINDKLDYLDTSQQADKKQVLQAVNQAIQEYKEHWYSKKRRTFEATPEFGAISAHIEAKTAQKPTFQYCVWALCKTAYAYATDKLNNGLSVFCDEHEQEKAIGALTAKLEKGGQHVREKSTSGKRATDISKSHKPENIRKKDYNMSALNLSISPELLAQYKALEQYCQEQNTSIEQWALKAFKWSLNRKICKVCHHTMQCKQNGQDNSIFWKCSNPQCDNKEQFDPLKSSQAPRTKAGFYCDICGTEREQWVYKGEMVYTCPNYKVCGAKMLRQKPAHLLQPKPAPQQQPAPQPQQYQPQLVPQSVPQQIPAQQPPVSVPQQQPESQMVEINDECPF
ncbi:hypothetical protein NHP190012_17120 (plasmid) [Helicobacter sp. NHP19-012]|uniref:Replication protein n=1 Tax=Helicobacter gastrofelis TaxID=2849642 RepID=A0ABN6I907_9HELI|nr:protein rep [Helicobacter sp. NHP19-012]BCZ20070.1 hypothetical protein NHP190012_17120 [Helicobacter sp. NHP19-012]